MPASKQEAIALGKVKAREYMDICGSCAQSTTMALQDALDLKNDAIARAATAMTGGIGGRGNACGSLLGSAMIMGLIYGIDTSNVADKDRMMDTIVRTGNFYQWFEQENGSPACREIMTRFGNGVYYDMGIPEQAEKAIELGIDQKCVDLVENTVAHVIDILWDDVQARK